jgi:hypothetical protein
MISAEEINIARVVLNADPKAQDMMPVSAEP